MTIVMIDTNTSERRPRFTLYIKAIDAPPSLYPSRCVVASLLLGSQAEVQEQHITIGPNYPCGPIQTALLQQVTRIISKIPAGAEIVLVSDFVGFWRAFGPEAPWLTKWKEDGFRKKPTHDRGGWKELSAILDAKDITIDASHSWAIDQDESLTLEELKIMAQEETRPTPQGDAP
jgi:hypothetical protein